MRGRKILKGFLFVGAFLGLILLYFYLQFRQELPADFAQLLKKPDRVILYSLKPLRRLSLSRIKAADLELDSVNRFTLLHDHGPEKIAQDVKASERKDYAAQEEKGEEFHRFEILGQTDLTGADAQTAANAFAEAAGSGWLIGPFRVQCFNPRHALRIVSEGHNYDFLLCYECAGIALYRDWEHIAYQTAVGSSAALNKLLTAANIPLH